MSIKKLSLFLRRHPPLTWSLRRRLLKRRPATVIPSCGLFLTAAGRRGGKGRSLAALQLLAGGLIKEGDSIAGVTIEGREGELRGKIVIAADGVLSFMAEKAG